MAARIKFKGLLLSLLLAILTLSFLYPLYFMLINSLKARAAYFANPFSLPGRA
jgi:ABC-type glycerol-3-phosphate transport system permease component